MQFGRGRLTVLLFTLAGVIVGIVALANVVLIDDDVAFASASLQFSDVELDTDSVEDGSATTAAPLAPVPTSVAPAVEEEAIEVELAEPVVVEDPVEEALGLSEFCGEDNCRVRLGAAETVLVLGDSHINIAKPIFIAWAEDNDFTLYQHSVGSCGWIRGATRTTLGPEKVQGCLNAQFATRDSLIAEIQPDIIVLHSRIYETHPKLETYLPTGEPSGEPIDDHLEETLSHFGAIDAQLILVESMPALEAPGAAGVECLATGGDECDFGVQEYMTNVVASAHPAVDASVTFEDLVCPEAQCTSTVDGVIVRFDGNHLTPEFVSKMLPDAVQRLQDVL